MPAAMARAVPLFGASLLLCCAVVPSQARGLWDARARALLQAKPPADSAAKAVPVLTVSPALARTPQPVSMPFGGWLSSHVVVVLVFLALVAFCTVYGADCMLFMFNREGYERLKQEREEFEEETRRRQRELYEESEGTPLLPVLDSARGPPRNKHSSARRGGRS